MRVMDYLTACEYVRRICQTSKLLTDQNFEKTILEEGSATSTLVICHTARDAEILSNDLIRKCRCNRARLSNRTLTTIKNHIIRFAWITNVDMLRGMLPTFVYVY